MKMEISISNGFEPGKIFLSNRNTKSSDKEPATSENQDSVNNISSLAKLFADTGLDPKNSFVYADKSQLTFNFDLQNSTEKSLTVNGFYSQEKRTLNIGFSYSFESIEEQNGKLFRKKYNIDFGMNISDVKKSSLTGSAKKEDILEYVKRVVKRIFEVADDEDISIGKVLFKKEDLQDILGYEDKKVRESIINLLNTAITVAKLKEFYNDRKDSKTIDFGVEREKYLEIVKKKSKEHKSESWLNISETSEEITNDSEDKDPKKVELGNSEKSSK